MNRGDITITVLSDNCVGVPDTLGEHGLSLLVETDTAAVLFDTGQGAVLPHNAGILRIGLERVQAVVLSHGHYDHTGGLAHALAQVRGARVFLHPAALKERFSRRDDVAREIGMPAKAREALEESGSIVVWTTSPTQVAPGVWVTGPTPRRNDFEDPGGPFFLDAAGKTSDPVEDDQALWVETPAGVVVVLGCAHAGVVNTLDYICEQTCGKLVRAVVGGMHLGSASEDRLVRTLAALEAERLATFHPCHCTGAAATARLLAAFGKRCQPCGVGARLRF